MYKSSDEDNRKVSVQVTPMLPHLRKESTRMMMMED